VNNEGRSAKLQRNGWKMLETIIIEELEKNFAQTVGSTEKKSASLKKMAVGWGIIIPSVGLENENYFNPLG
jgi:hypothetical protein